MRAASGREPRVRMYGMRFRATSSNTARNDRCSSVTPMILFISTFFMALAPWP